MAVGGNSTTAGGVPAQPVLIRESDQRVAQLQHALTSRLILEQAKGVLSERFALTPDQAFDLLRTSARNNRQPIHELAAEIVATPDTPGGIVRALASRPDYIEVATQRLNRLGQVASQIRQARLQQARREEGERRRR